ncbi:hypothetical protein THRCLA_00040 [Thraustotheca clavata]|uniref:Uncharacterized protein n=1 Tax=Thraustotheca clavata TaxID=74557 RepID=A0A1W0ACC4_9STRA|nr:hypothetical protein THRCLA_00040 [Thraustotheca clavata]
MDMRAVVGKENVPPIRKNAKKPSSKCTDNKTEKVQLIANKGYWAPEDDQKLRALVYGLGTKNWNEIGSHFPHKSGRQCHERWKHFCNELANTQQIKIEQHDFTTAFSNTLLAKRSTHTSVKRFSTPSPLVEKVNKLNNIANKLKHRQDHSPDGVALAIVPPAVKRKLEHWSMMYGIDVNQMEYVTFVKRPPAPPTGYRPRRIVRQTKRQKIDPTSTYHDTMFLNQEEIHEHLKDMIGWKYPNSEPLQSQFRSINNLVVCIPSQYNCIT